MTQAPKRINIQVYPGGEVWETSGAFPRGEAFDQEYILPPTPPVGNATYHIFKPSGKWYSTERGILPKELFFGRNEILDNNGGRMPGLSYHGHDMMVIIIPDDDCEQENSFPRMFHAGPEV